jgi:ribosomal protein S25
VDGPLVLQTSGGGAVVKKVTLDGERATCGRETARALLSNKLLTKAKVMLSDAAENVFELTFCADGLLLKGVKVPDCESLNAEDQLIERLESCEELWTLVGGLVERFAIDRGPDMETAMRQWVADKGRENAKSSAGAGRAERAAKAFVGSVEKGGSVSVEVGGQEVLKVEKDSAGKVVASNPSEVLYDEDLYQQAVKVIRAVKRASTSVLQRRLRIGYNRAAVLMDLLEDRGIVGPVNVAGPREILELPVSDVAEENGDR